MGEDLTTFMCRVSRNSGALTYQNPKGHWASSGITLPFYIYIYQSLHVSGDYVPIIRRNNCVYAALGT